MREQHQRAAEHDQRRPLASEEAGQGAEVDVVGGGVVRQLDDAMVADAGGAFGMVAEVATGPARQGGDRRADRRQARVDGEVGERGALDAHVRVGGAHRGRDRARGQDFEDLEILEPGLDLLAGVAEARPDADGRVVRRRDALAERVAPGVEDEPAAVHATTVGEDGPVRALEIGHGAGFAAGLDLCHPLLRGIGRPRDRYVHAYPSRPTVMLLRCVKPSSAPSIEYSEPRPLSFLPP